jgi:hypothetical protein
MGEVMESHDELRALLARIRRRWFVLAALGAVARAASAAAALIVTAAVAAWLVSPAGWRLVSLMAVATAAAAAAVSIVVFRMPRRPDDCQVARFVEERTGASDVAPALCDTFTSAVRVIESPEQHTGGFGALLVDRALRALRDTDPAAVIPPERLRRSGLVALAGVALLAVAIVLAKPHLLRAGATAWVALFPETVQIVVSTGNARVAAGQPLRIAATVRGRGVGVLSLAPSLVVSANGQQRTVPMSASGDGFSYTIASVDRSFEYRVVAGSSASRAFSVTALFPPRVTSIDLAYEYPAFTGLKPRDEKNGGDVYAPAGTRVRLVVHADKALASGELAMSGAAPVAMQADDRTAAAELVLAADGGYRVRLTDADGLGSLGEVEYFIRVMDDRPPAVQIVRPTDDQGITPLQEVAVEARADDDYGIAQFDLVYSVAGRAAKTVPFTRVSGTDVARIGTHLIAAEELGVQPGDVIAYYARARDVARGKRSSETRSDMFFLEVKPFNEEFVQAQSQGMGAGASATQIDTLIAAQKEIINATWNLERRSGAGRSAEDLKAVAEAQAELKGRAEQIAGRGPRGGRGLFPQQLLPPSRSGASARQAGQGRERSGSRDPVAAAIEAMTQAVEHLQGARTADAIEHEMAALRGLLQAQAEVRRRQVMQQSASAAGQGGSNRSDRDLSALFDRELQRQQRTNYETPPQSADTPPQNESELLDRIRELARRQAELAARQRELANGNLSADEVKRQLERLSREQEELRQQAEALQNDVKRSTSANAGRGRGGASSESSGDMQRAAEQMRNAAGEMQRQNAGGAAASGERAAEALRQLERQMRGSSADARQRTAGELRLEAQQIADAQRRSAAEAARLEKERSGSATDRATADALKRLAAEKDKLADRIDRLQQRARDAEGDAPGAEGAPLREAARQLHGQQAGARMRDSAQQLRDRATAGTGASQAGSGPQSTSATPSAAQREQQLTRTLESVANALNGGGTDEGRKLADQLDRTRDMRDRLNGLEQQLRSAEAQAAAGRSGDDGRSGAPSPGGGRGTEQGGRQAGQGSGSGNGPGAIQRAREEYARELQRSRESLGRMRAEQRGSGGSTPEQHEFSLSSPGNEAFKQDFGSWESLRKDIDLALEQFEAAASARLAPKAADRLSGGGSERIPDAYHPVVSRYFEAIAKPAVRRPPEKK